jgi:UDP-N-acetylmuramate--alanine ligase
MDCYHDMADVERAFVEFMDRVPFYGAVTACADNALLKGILPRLRRRVFTYGESEEADFRLELIDSVRAPGQARGSAAGQGSSFSRFLVHTAAGPLGPFELHVPGRHNVLNATAAVAIARQLEVPQGKIAEGLAHFCGVDRRFQQRGEARGVAVVDDYGHHPTEIAATLRAARAGFPDRRLVVAFQPHRYTRTQALLEEFGSAFFDADLVLVTDIYAASEAPIPGITGRTVVEAILAHGQREAIYVPRVEDLAQVLDQATLPGDLVVTLGAGNITSVGPAFLDLE